MSDSTHGAVELRTRYRVLLLPGWHNSGPTHWQSRWESLHGFARVLEHDWARPLRGDWLIQLEEAVLAAPRPVVLVAHSLGCIHAAAWAAHSRHSARVHAALLVAPADVERPDLAERLPTWQPIARQRLPFASLLVASRNDPYCTHARALELAHCWGSAVHDLGEAGHINADSGLSDWPEGLALLHRLCAGLSASPPPTAAPAP